MAPGAAWLWDMDYLYQYPGGRNVIDIIKYEAKVYCNVLARCFHIDLHNLVKGSDTLAIRSLDGDSSWDNVGALM